MRYDRWFKQFCSNITESYFSFNSPNAISELCWKTIWQYNIIMLMLSFSVSNLETSSVIFLEGYRLWNLDSFSNRPLSQFL